MKDTGPRFLLTLGLVLLTSSPNAAEKGVFSSGERQVSLLEVYSSEGCSSCPPAEEWLSRLKKSPDLWTKVVPLCFHVDYWDYIGWKDAFAASAFTERQRAYAQQLRMESVYTPGFILNGREWRGWFDGRPNLSFSSSKSGLLTVELKKSWEFEIFYHPTDTLEYEWQADIVILGMDIISAVKAGENRGRTLPHDFVVLRHESKKLTGTLTAVSAVINLPAPTIKAKSYAVAVWVTKDGDLTPIQAVGGHLPNEKSN